VYVGMNHWTPRIAEAVENALADGAERIVGVVLAPHYSTISIGGYRRLLEAAVADRAELVFVESWHDHEPFIDFVADRIRGTDAHVVFTAHSLPERILAEGDPYRDQLIETSHLVADRAGAESWSVAFQSESATGEPWLGPDILDELERLHREGVRKVLVAPVGFVSDHLEIQWDIDVEAREKAAELGLDFDRIASPNDDPVFISGLAALVRQVTQVPNRIEAR
jgi:ferrochelatase